MIDGLLWPEPQARIAHTAWLTSERLGAGQVILFAGNATLRGASHGMQRLLGNAVVCGQGAGTSAVIEVR